MLKYKASKDIPRLASKLRSLSPTEIANAASTEHDKKVTAMSVSMWLQRHPDLRKELNQQLNDIESKKNSSEAFKEKVLAEIYVNNAPLFEITNLQTLEIARKYLDIVEEMLKP